MASFFFNLFFFSFYTSDSQQRKKKQQQTNETKTLRSLVVILGQSSEWLTLINIHECVLPVMLCNSEEIRFEKSCENGLNMIV